jgi:hypothetical protein
MDQRRILLVLRHAQTEDTRPGSRDSERRLTPDGERDAEQVGDYLRKQDIMIDTVLCSSAARTRQTLELLKLGDQLDPDRVQIADLFYNAGSDTCLMPSESFVTIATSPCSLDMHRAHQDWCMNSPNGARPVQKRSPQSRVDFRLLALPSWSSTGTGQASRDAR